MNINGLQKLTLLDFPGHTACTVFLAGCDMKCPFCHNSELIDGTAPALYTEKDLLKFLEKRKGLLDGVAFTGGEPTLRKDLADVMRQVKELGYAVKLDTNGNHPDVLKKLFEENLVDYVAMDIKNDINRYKSTAGTERVNMDAILESISLVKNSGTDYEFRTTVVDQLHDEESFMNISQIISGAKRYFLQPFTDRESVAFSGFTAPSKEKLENYAEIMRKTVQSVEIRGLD